MATTEELYNTETGAGTGTETAPAASTGAATSPYVTGNASLDAYNTARYDQINNMYDAQRQSALTQLESGYNKNLSDAQAAYDKITPKYQESRNQMGAEYERQRRNNNLQAASNGLNTGAGSQMQLAASNAYQAGQAQLQKAENEALNESERNMLTLKEQYQADIAKAQADNDNQRAAALLNEYGQQYDRMQNEAKTAASYGDFSLYRTLYGDAVATQMEQAWLLQNPQLAYTMGRITADQYFSMTGKYPPGYGGGDSSGYSGYSGGGYGGYSGNDGGGDDSSKLSYKNIALARAEGYSDEQIKKAAETAGYTDKEIDMAMTRASMQGVAGGHSAAGALKTASANNTTTQPTQSGSVLPNIGNAIKDFGKGVASIINPLLNK